MDEHKSNRSATDILRELASGTSDLLRQEVALAKAEGREKVQQVSRGIKLLVIGGAVLLVSLFYILDAIVYGLARLLPEGYQLWGAALIVGVVVTVAGVLFLKKGATGIMTTHLSPSRTTTSVKRDAQTVRGSLS